MSLLDNALTLRKASGGPVCVPPARHGCVTLWPRTHGAGDTSRRVQRHANRTWRVSGIANHQPHSAHVDRIEAIELSKSNRRSLGQRTPRAIALALEDIRCNELSLRYV